MNFSDFATVMVGIAIVGIVGVLLYQFSDFGHQISHMSGSYDNSEVLTTLENIRKQLSKEIELARFQVSSTGDELRGQMSHVKQRIQWLIMQYDKLQGVVDKLEAAAKANDNGS